MKWLMGWLQEVEETVKAGEEVPREKEDERAKAKC